MTHGHSQSVARLIVEPDDSQFLIACPERKRSMAAFSTWIVVSMTIPDDGNRGAQEHRHLRFDQPFSYDHRVGLMTVLGASAVS